MGKGFQNVCFEMSGRGDTLDRSGESACLLDKGGS